MSARKRLWKNSALLGAILWSLSGCDRAPLRVPILAQDHPARPVAQQGVVPPPPAVLDVDRADRRNPQAQRGVELHPELPMHHMSDSKHGQSGN